MIKERERVVRNAVKLFDGVMVALAYLLVFFIRTKINDAYTLDVYSTKIVLFEFPDTMVQEYLKVLLISVLTWSFMLHMSGIYRSMRTRTIPELILLILKAACYTGIVFGSIMFFLKMKLVSRSFITIFMAVSVIVLMLEKVAVVSVMRWARKQGHNQRRLLIVGTGERAIRFIIKVMNHPQWGIDVVGLINDEPGRPAMGYKGVEVIGELKDITAILHDHPADEVVFVLPRSRLSYIEKAVYACEIEGVKVTIAVDLFECKIARSRITELDGMPLLTFETTIAKEWQLFIKRWFDIIVSGSAMVVLSPIFLITAIMVKVTSPGPIFFKQKRIGLSGRRFILYKFRTMQKDADKKRFKMEKENEADGLVFKIKSDPRITSIGKFLRKSSIDEFPQFFNVFMGHMSIVGPRPLAAYEVSKFEPWQRRRQSMRPGLTCIWQISGRSNVAFERWMGNGSRIHRRLVLMAGCCNNG